MSVVQVTERAWSLAEPWFLNGETISGHQHWKLKLSSAQSVGFFAQSVESVGESRMNACGMCVKAVEEAGVKFECRIVQSEDVGINCPMLPCTGG